MPILVLEGVNCCGKSTLGKMFAEDTGLEYVKFSMAPVVKTFDYFWDKLVEAHRRRPHFVVDRCHLSNMVYGDLQGSGLLNPGEWNILDMWLAEQDAWLFLMTDDVFRIEERMLCRNRDIDKTITSRPQIAGLQRRFEQAYEQSVIPTKGEYHLRQFLQINPATMLASDQTTQQYQDILANFERRADLR